MPPQLWRDILDGRGLSPCRAEPNNEMVGAVPMQVMMFHRFTTICRLALIALAFGAWVSAVHAQVNPIVFRSEDLSGGLGPVSGPRVAAAGNGRVAIAWTVEEGPNAGVYVRERRELLWQTVPSKINGRSGAQPRDLVMAYDSRERLHLVWTGIEASYRKVFHAVNTGPESAEPPAIVNLEDDADADYPQIALAGGDRILCVWQEAWGARFSIEAGFLESSGGVTRLAAPSGSNPEAMAPQILRADPPTVAFYAIFEKDNDLRIVRHDSASGTWAPTSLTGIDSRMPFRRQPLFMIPSEGSPLGYWHEEDAEGRSSIRIAGPSGSVEGALVIHGVDEPLGQHRRPQLDAQGGADRLVLSWQVFSAGHQGVRLGLFDWPSGTRRVLDLAPGLHRFASDPSHITMDSKVYAVWADDFRAGGTGWLGFAEILPDRVGAAF